MPYARDIENLTALVDGLMWSTRPTTLSTYGYCYDFVKVLVSIFIRVIFRLGINV